MDASTTTLCDGCDAGDVADRGVVAMVLTGGDALNRRLRHGRRWYPDDRVSAGGRRACRTTGGGLTQAVTRSAGGGGCTPSAGTLPAASPTALAVASLPNAARPMSLLAWLG
jgi:hypothetical protein